MHAIDLSVFFFLRGIANNWPRLEDFVQILTDNDLAKAGPVLAAIWVLWFVRDAKTEERRTGIVSTLAAGCTAALFSVALTRVLPIRLRPVFEPSLSFAFTIHEGTPAWSRNSSLPSDHAAMFVALACGLIFVSRRWGLLMLLHALLFVMLPRAFVGLHYFWDLMAGASIGVVFALCWNSEYVRSRISRPLVRLEATHAPAFYGWMFVVTLQIFDLFQGSRALFGLLTTAGGAMLRSARIALN